MGELERKLLMVLLTNAAFSVEEVIQIMFNYAVPEVEIMRFILANPNLVAKRSA